MSRPVSHEQMAHTVAGNYSHVVTNVSSANSELDIQRHFRQPSVVQVGGMNESSFIPFGSILILLSMISSILCVSLLVYTFLV